MYLCKARCVFGFFFVLFFFYEGWLSQNSRLHRQTAFRMMDEIWRTERGNLSLRFRKRIKKTAPNGGLILRCFLLSLNPIHLRPIRVVVVWLERAATCLDGEFHWLLSAITSRRRLKNTPLWRMDSRCAPLERTGAVFIDALCKYSSFVSLNITPPGERRCLLTDLMYGAPALLWLLSLLVVIFAQQYIKHWKAHSLQVDSITYLLYLTVEIRFQDSFIRK